MCTRDPVSSARSRNVSHSSRLHTSSWRSDSQAPTRCSTAETPQVLIKRDVAVDGVRRGEPHRGGKPIADVHRGLRDQAADAELRRGAGHLVGMWAAGIGETCRAHPEQVGVGDLGRIRYMSSSVSTDSKGIR